MQNVPKIVRERLEAASPIANHPDADLLTAFTERSLGKGERSMVLEHLARCGDCRDIVALSLPATERVESAMKAPAKGWLTWPVLRWGFVTAGVVAIASVGIVQYRLGMGEQSLTSKGPAHFEVTAKEARNQPMASPAPAVTKQGDNIQSPAASAFVDSVDAKKATLNQTTRLTPAGAGPAPVPPPTDSGHAGLGVRALLPHGPRLASQWQQQNGVQNQSAVPAASSPFAKQQAAGDLSSKMEVPAVSETVTVESQATQFDTLAQNQDTTKIEARQSKGKDDIEKDQPPAPLSSSEDYAVARVGKAKPAEEGVSTAGIGARSSTVTAPLSAQLTGGTALTLVPPVPRWTINPTGGLQRSFDQGSTWQVVNVNANPAYFTDATGIQIVGKTSHAKIRKVPSPVFRAVAATGPDVWAGASGGALYHSPDAGDHWTRVLPASAGAVLTGDIVSLEFSDVLHGKVSTSTSEIWTTSDDGQSWQKQ